MDFKKIVSAILALLVGLFTGCKVNEKEETESSSDKVTSEVTTQKGNGGGTAEKTPGNVIITALNVGKADCFVIQTSKSVTMIDTGTEESVEAVEAFLNKNGITRIHQLMITHFDRDHVGGADHVLKKCEVDKVYSTYYIAKDSDDIDEYKKALKKKGLSPILVDTERSYTLDGVTWELYPPEKDDYKKEISNNSSMVARMSYGKVSALFTADAQKARIAELLEQPNLKSDIIKMPHHGGFEKNLDDLIELVQPKYAILTGSNAQPEDEETMSLLKKNGVKSYCTKDGDIVIKTDGKTVTVSQ